MEKLEPKSMREIPENLSADELVVWNEMNDLYDKYEAALEVGKFSIQQLMAKDKEINDFADEFRKDFPKPGYFLLWHFVAGSTITPEMKNYKLDTEDHLIEIFLRRLYKKYGIK